MKFNSIDCHLTIAISDILNSSFMTLLNWPQFKTNGKINKLMPGFLTIISFFSKVFDHSPRPFLNPSSFWMGFLNSKLF